MSSLAMPDEEVKWDRACSIATAMEAANQDAREMLTQRNGEHTANVVDAHWQQAS